MTVIEENGVELALLRELGDPHTLVGVGGEAVRVLLGLPGGIVTSGGLKVEIEPDLLGHRAHSATAA